MKKGLKILGLTLLLLALVLLSFPIIFKKQISERVKQEINSQINGQVNYDDFSFSFLTHFPNPTISLSQFSLTGGPDFNGLEIASIKKVSFSVDLMSVLRGHNYRVISFNVADANFNLKVNKDGKADWDVMKYAVAFSKAEGVAQNEKQADFSLQVNSWKVEHASLSYTNDTTHTSFELKDLSADGTQLLNRAGYELKSNTSANELSYMVGGISCFSKTKVNADIHFTSEPSTGLYTFENNLIQLNELHLKLDGTVKNSGEGQNFNLKVQSADTTFKVLLSIVPMLSHDSSHRLNVTGGFSFSVSIAGPYHKDQFPAIKAAMRVTNGSLNNPDLPVAMKNINLMASIEKPQGPFDSTVIEISRLHIETGKDSLNTTLRVTTPASDANIQARVSGSIDPSLIPGLRREDIPGKASGLSLNLKFSGRKSDIDGMNYERAQPLGSANLLNCIFQKRDMPVAVHIAQAGFSLRPGVIVLDKVSASVGKSEFSATGTINGLMPYLTQQGQFLVTLDASSTLVTLQDIIPAYQTSKTARGTAVISGNQSGQGVVENKGSAVFSPEVIINFHIGELRYGQAAMQHLLGQIEISGDHVSLHKTTADIVGGGLSLTSNVMHVNSPASTINFNIGFNNISVQQVNRALKQGGIEVASLQNIIGNFSGELNGTGALNADKSVNYRSVHADGKTNCPDLRIDELPVLMDISKLAKVSSFEHMEAKNIQCNFHFNNGKTTIDPTDIKFTTGTNINFKGVCDASQNVDADIALNVPVKEFGQVGALAQNLLGSFMKVPQNMQFKFKVTGPMNKPAVKVAGVGTSDN